MACDVFVLGSFVADAAYRVPRLPIRGETLVGSSFAFGPGGKGSNQAVAAARAGARVALLTKVGRDLFGELGWRTWETEGIDTSHVGTGEVATGSAAILVDEGAGDNAIAIVPGACGTLIAADVEAAATTIRSAKVFLAQLEVPIPVVQRGLAMAREAGVTTILNPAPAQPLPPDLLRLVDLLVPNETEAAQLSGLSGDSPDAMLAAARALQAGGAQQVLVTRGEKGVLCRDAEGGETWLSAIHAGRVVDTTGAGDTFCGSLAAALAEQQAFLGAVRFASVAAGISVTRPGAALSAPLRNEIDAVLLQQR